MIPRVEERLIAELERRIVAAMPETAPGDGATPETFVTTIESRTVVLNVQEESGLTIFCNVTAEISVVFYTQKTRCDYSALLADFASRPFIELGGACARLRIEKSEAVEGPYLSNDAWLFRAEYPVFDLHESADFKGVKISMAPEIGRKHEEIYQDMENANKEYQFNEFGI